MIGEAFGQIVTVKLGMIEPADDAFTAAHGALFGVIVPKLWAIVLIPVGCGRAAHAAPP